MCIVSKEDCPEPCCKTSVSKMTYFKKNMPNIHRWCRCILFEGPSYESEMKSKIQLKLRYILSSIHKNVQGSLSILGALSIPIHCFLANAPLMHRSGCHCSHSRCLKDANTQCKPTQIQIQIHRWAIVHCRNMRNLVGRANWWGEFCVMWRARPILMPKQFRW